jgi:hypothetical protein
LRARPLIIALAATVAGTAVVTAAAVRGGLAGTRDVAPANPGMVGSARFASQQMYECPSYTIMDPAPAPRHQFYFTRGQYSGGGGFGGFGRRGGRRGSGWATDFEKADRQFLVVLRRLVGIDAFPCENTVAFDDPAVFRFPFIYILEVGSMRLTPPEVEGMRNWLDRGGFLFVDDFWGLGEWRNFEYEMSRVLPEYPIVELSLDHPIFNTVYHVTKVEQVPSINNGCNGNRYWEDASDTTPRVFGIFNDKGRLMVVVTYNSDLGDAWEWAEQACYPVDRSTWAFQVGVNFIVYALSH